MPDPLPGIPVAPSPSLTALGCSLHQDFQTSFTGDPRAAAASPTEQRTAAATVLAQQLVAMADSQQDECIVHSVFVLLQHSLCRALDFDVRTVPVALVRPRLGRLEAAA